MKKEIPILFSTEMVQAILAGTKTMTRRIMKPQPADILFSALICDYSLARFWTPPEPDSSYEATVSDIKNKFGKPGDILWVRETWCNVAPDQIAFKIPAITTTAKWKPSIHLKKTHSRIWLEITNIKVERLHSISEQDAIKEGIKNKLPHIHHLTAVYQHYTDPQIKSCKPTVSFFSLWEKINGKESLDANPWVWCIEFKVLSTTGKPQNL